MANELQVSTITGKTVYFLLRTATGTIWNGSSFESYAAGNYANYPISSAEQGASAYYTGNMPAVVRGYYNVIAKVQGGGSPAQSDTTAGNGWVNWDGTAVQIYPANFAVSSIDVNGRYEFQSNLTKNAAFSNFSFLMVLSSDHISPAIGKSVTALRSQDGGAFASCDNLVSAISNGAYKINLTANDMNASIVLLRFTAPACDDRFVELQTTP